MELSPSIAMTMARLRQDARTGEPALAAISGGRDSVALLHILLATGHRHLIVCHLNHGLRGRESGQDAAFVRRLATRHDLLCELEKVDVASIAARSKVSVETAARDARLEFLARMAAKHGATRAFLAHHADDQAETILANLCRGASLRGLSGMKSAAASKSGLSLLRPLLEVRRAEIDAYVKTHGLSFREDSSNVGLEYRRNRLRHQVLPLLNDIFRRDVSPVLARVGTQAERDEDCLSLQAQAVLLEPGLVQSDQSLMITASLRQLHPAVLSRVLHRWLTQHLGLKGIETEDISRACSMLAPAGPSKINLPDARHLRRRARRLFVE